MTVGPLTSRDDAHALADLFARTMGAGWFPPASVETFAAMASDARFGLVARDGESGLLVGGLLGEVVPPDALPGTFLAGYEAVKDDARVARLRQGRVGLISAIAVEEHARERGVATRLVQTGVDELARRGAGGFYAFAWTTSEKGCHLGGVLERAGFSPVRRFEQAFKDFSLRHDCRCPFCGQPCRCSAWLYVRVDAA